MLAQKGAAKRNWERFRFSTLPLWNTAMRRISGTMAPRSRCGLRPAPRGPRAPETRVEITGDAYSTVDRSRFAAQMHELHGARRDLGLRKGRDRGTGAGHEFKSTTGQTADRELQRVGGRLGVGRRQIGAV